MSVDSLPNEIRIPATPPHPDCPDPSDNAAARPTQKSDLKKIIDVLLSPMMLLTYFFMLYGLAMAYFDDYTESAWATVVLMVLPGLTFLVGVALRPVMLRAGGSPVKAVDTGTRWLRVLLFGPLVGLSNEERKRAITSLEKDICKLQEPRDDHDCD